MHSNLNQAMEEMRGLRQFAGPARDFWPRYVAAAAQLAGADATVLMLGQPGKEPRWTRIADWEAGTGLSRLRTQFTSRLPDFAGKCVEKGSFMECTDASAGAFVLALRLALVNPSDEVVLAVQLKDFTESAARESYLRLSLVMDVPSAYQQNLSFQKSRQDVEKFAAVLDLNVPVNDATRFIPAALAVCNGIATRFRCDRASLGWLEGGYVRLRAMSRTEQFDRQMAAAQAMETAMEECVDQDEEIVWPESAEAASVSRDHEAFAMDQKSGHVCSLPWRLDDKVVAVLLCERRDQPFTQPEIQQLRLASDQVVRRMADLHSRDLWFGARWKAGLEERLPQWLGPGHAWSKVGAILGVLVLAGLIFIRVTYRVGGNFILRSDQAEFLTAPFDGYIREVYVRAGDPVVRGQPLVMLNQDELLLDQAAAAADVSRYERQAEKDRAADDMAQMRIDQAQARQAQAQLDLVHFRLDHSVLRAGLDGVVIEGDLRERIGSPVKQGDALLRVTRLDTLYAQAEIPESDIHEIAIGASGQIAFVTLPKTRFPVSIRTVEPAAVPQKDGSVFLVRLEPQNRTPDWWRPGMTGLCKLESGKRSLIWILTHRTVDFLRMKLWW